MELNGHYQVGCKARSSRVTSACIRQLAFLLRVGVAALRGYVLGLGLKAAW